jgi:hypothetical protein
LKERILIVGQRYVGSEDGIFEIKINVEDRMVFPSVTMR